MLIHMTHSLWRNFLSNLWDDAHSNRAFWQTSTLWEQSMSNDWDLWMADDEDVREQNMRAFDLQATDSAAAFDMYRELAGRGSVWAMQQAGRHLEFGWGTERDLAAAENFYDQALMAGSWTATLRLARLLCNHRINETWVAILQDGVDSGFLPSSFWLGWLQYERSPRKRTARAVRPLIEQAAAGGHPGARLVLARWKMRGRFGWREMRQGAQEFRTLLGQHMDGTLRNGDDAADMAVA